MEVNSTVSWIENVRRKLGTNKLLEVAFIYDETAVISLKALRKLGFFSMRNQEKEGVITIRRQNALYEDITALKIKVVAEEENGVLSLIFTDDGKSVNQRLILKKKLNDPPGGYKWYIECPDTGKNCTKLYLYHGIFKSRWAIGNGSYKIQTVRFGAKRSFYRRVQNVFKAETLMETVYNPYFKKYYANHLTLKHQKALKAKTELNRIAAMW